MKFSTLNPYWLGNGGEGVTVAATGESVPRREGVAIGFDCPCGCDFGIAIYLRNPTDGGPSLQPEGPSWQRTGLDFETLTLEPSIRRMGGCRWHGFITKGDVIACADGAPNKQP